MSTVPFRLVELGSQTDLGGSGCLSLGDVPTRGGACCSLPGRLPANGPATHR